MAGSSPTSGESLGVSLPIASFEFLSKILCRHFTLLPFKWLMCDVEARSVRSGARLAFLVSLINRRLDSRLELAALGFTL
jgi:hypothetical protein